MTSSAAATRVQSEFMKPFWSAVVGPPWLVSLAAFAVIAAARFFAILSPYPLQELFFLQTAAMWALPFILLTAEGRHQIGLTAQGVTRSSMAQSVLAGCLCALGFFAVGMAIYGLSADNWCVSLRNYLHLDEMRGLISPLGLFFLYALPAISLNPIGEEILFRGVIRESIERRFSPLFATAVSSMLFASVYLSLHGIWHNPTGYHLRLVSTAIAFVLMVCVGSIFSLCRTLTGSLWPAVGAHAAFNLTLLAASIRVFLH